MRSILFLYVAILAVPAIAGERPPVTVNGTAIVAPAPGAAVHRFGSGAQIERPGQPAQTVAPFGSGVIVSQPGRPSVVCSPFGSGTICR
ncbi:MAG: hypothetical protein GEU87_15050 [Alphaproteobacteria bacterium]|nr:hypothetical protein [Alphaproteobacteria bacterium]